MEGLNASRSAEQVVNSYCVFQKLSNNWKLCLKMRPKDCQRNNPTNDLMAILEDIFANPEEGCSVLQVRYVFYELMLCNHVELSH